MTKVGDVGVCFIAEHWRLKHIRLIYKFASRRVFVYSANASQYFQWAANFRYITKIISAPLRKISLS